MAKPAPLLRDVAICTAFGWIARGWWERQVEAQALRVELKRAPAEGELF